MPSIIAALTTIVVRAFIAEINVLISALVVDPDDMVADDVKQVVCVPDADDAYVYRHAL